jgi:hypothetical protein
MVHFFHEGGGLYLKGEKPLTLSSISNTGLIDDVPPLSANGTLRFIRIIYMGQGYKYNNPLPDLKYPFIDFACFSLLFDIPVF